MDFQGIITRLRPNSRYLLRDGGGALYSDILEWQDQNTTQPTEQECLDEWDVMLAEWEAARLEEESVSANKLDAETRFLLSQLANKTPQQIFTAMQEKMDAWGSLSDAKADLKEWLPLMAAYMVWKNQ